MNFVSRFRLELMYISLTVSIRSSLTHLHGFQLLVLLPWFIESFFCLHQQNKSSESKVKFRKASNHCKRVLEAVKLAYIVLKQKNPSLPETWLLGLLVNF